MPKPKTKTQRQREIDRLVLELDKHEPTSEKYGDVLNRLSKLHKMEQDYRPNRPSADTVVAAGANILGIAMIIRHENLNVITTKALTFVSKLK